MIAFSLCKNCGDPYDLNEIADGYCINCMPDGDPDVQQIIDELTKDAEE